jgi:hypothetical protein
VNLRLGDVWAGADGTVYDVVLPQQVRSDQPRWWIDLAPSPGDRMCGPAHVDRLHLYPAGPLTGTVEHALVER